MRVKTKDKSHRLLYFSYIDKKFIFTNAFTKKTQKTPKNEIEIALKKNKSTEVKMKNSDYIVLKIFKKNLLKITLY